MLTPGINQNAASIKFSEIIYGAEPVVVQSVSLASGFSYNALGSLIGTPVASPGSSFVLFDSTDETQMLWGVTYDTWVNTVDVAASLTPINFTGNIATTAGNLYTPTVGNITGSNGLTPNLAQSVITGVNVNANNLVLGARITGVGIPAGSTIIQILSPTVIVISGNVTATATDRALVTYPVEASNALVGVATVQGNSTQWIKSALVGVNGATDITTYLTGNPTLARSFNRYNGAVAIPVVTFTFMGGK